MAFENDPEPERADDFDVPAGVRPLLWLVLKVTPVLRDAADAGQRLDVESDRSVLALNIVGAVLKELAEQGNTVHVLEPPAEVSAASDYNLAKVVTELLTVPPDDVDWEAKLHPWYLFLRAHADEMSDEEKFQVGHAYATATTAAEYGDNRPAECHLPRLMELAGRWRDDPNWPGAGAES